METAGYNYSEVAKASIVVNSWPLMGTPIPVLTILVFYLYFVLKLGPQWMEKKSPYTLKWTMIVYNFIQVIFSAWLSSHMFINFDGFIRTIYYTCKAPMISKDLCIRMLRADWWYFIAKVIELFDTILFVLRKKQSQITFLHVYHHASTMIVAWLYVKYFSGPQGTVIAFLNSTVHIIMYSYYLIAALGPKYQKYLWWKKYLTRIQLTQFGIMVIYLTLLVLMDCQIPQAFTYFSWINCFVFIYLFSSFYRKSYQKQKCLEKNVETGECFKTE